MPATPPAHRSLKSVQSALPPTWVAFSSRRRWRIKLRTNVGNSVDSPLSETQVRVGTSRWPPATEILSWPTAHSTSRLAPWTDRSSAHPWTRRSWWAPTKHTWTAARLPRRTPAPSALACTAARTPSIPWPSRRWRPTRAPTLPAKHRHSQGTRSAKQHSEAAEQTIQPSYSTCYATQALRSPLPSPSCVHIAKPNPWEVCLTKRPLMVSGAAPSNANTPVKDLSPVSGLLSTSVRGYKDPEVGSVPITNFFSDSLLSWLRKMSSLVMLFFVARSTASFKPPARSLPASQRTLCLRGRSVANDGDAAPINLERCRLALPASQLLSVGALIRNITLEVAILSVSVCVCAYLSAHDQASRSPSANSCLWGRRPTGSWTRIVLRCSTATWNEGGSSVCVNAWCGVGRTWAFL